MTTTLSIDIGTKNLAWCLFEGDIPSEGRVENIHARTIRESLDRAIALLPGLALARQASLLVLIEQQPLRHARMLSIMHGLYGAYRALGCDVHIVSPQLRLPLLALSDKKATYAQRKRAAVAACLARFGDGWKAWLQGRQKADDLADAILLGHAFLCRCKGSGSSGCVVCTEP